MKKEEKDKGKESIKGEREKITVTLYIKFALPKKGMKQKIKQMSYDSPKINPITYKGGGES